MTWQRHCRAVRGDAANRSSKRQRPGPGSQTGDHVYCAPCGFVRELSSRRHDKGRRSELPARRPSRTSGHPLRESTGMVAGSET
jgi:hypothetical protein